MTHEPNSPSAALLDVSSLPALPETLADLIDACNRPDVDIQELGLKVARDASVSAMVLQLANSAFIGARSAFADIVQAVIYLGVDTTRNLVISVAVHETFRSVDGAGVLSLAEFWYHSLLTAVLAKSLAPAAGKVLASEAYLTGLLHDIGKLMLLKAFPAKYRKVLQDGETPELEARERQYLGITHSEAAALLIGHWRLQPDIVEAVRGHHRDEPGMRTESPLTKILFCADRLSRCPWPDIGAAAETVCDLLAIDIKTLQVFTADAQATVDEIAENMGIRISRETAPRKVAPSAGKIARKRLSDKILALSRIDGFLDNLVKAQDLERVYTVIEESLALLLPIDGCLFFLPEGPKNELLARGSTQNSFYKKTKGLRIPAVGKPGMVPFCLEHLVPVDSLAYAADYELGMVEQSLLNVFESNCLVAVPMVIAGSAPGCIVLGISPSGIEILRERVSTLLLLAGYAGMRLRLEKTYRRHAENLAAARVGAAAEVARSIAHEISNPITVLNNYLAVLEMKLAQHPDLTVDFEIIRQEIGRIGAISEELKDLSNNAGAQVRQPVDLNVLLADVLNFFRQSLARKNRVELCSNLPPNVPAVLSNGTKIRQILGNLIKNAIEAVDGKGIINVAAETASFGMDSRKGVAIIVEDDGPGIQNLTPEDIFQAGITTKKDGHAGLGLAIVQKLANEIGGKVTCAARPERGMRFTFTLPLE